MISSLLYWGWIAGSPFVGLLSSYMGKNRIILQCSSLLAAIAIFSIIYFPTSDPIIAGVMMFLLGLFVRHRFLFLLLQMTMSLKDIWQLGLLSRTCWSCVLVFYSLILEVCLNNMPIIRPFLMLMVFDKR